MKPGWRKVSNPHKNTANHNGVHQIYRSLAGIWPLKSLERAEGQKWSF